VYTRHFGLKEIPFSIAPDPAYLYMSPRHQEALGHLLYGTGRYGGFVQLTGEVGTGKTTIIRTLLAQRLDNVDVAMIHNPRQSEREFVQSICDELHIAYAKPADGSAPTLKTLVDALNEYLVARHAEGRRTVLIIDEAQQLAPDVLEQVRLLTNLETHKEKLLRIMLVGQPELAELLARQDLRQLAQRITARYHLTPLSTDETGEYIAHRLQVAGGARDLFTPAAVKRIHKYSGGVPRLVNVLCDRALLGAYAQSVRQVTPEMVELAAREVFGSDLPAPRAAPAPTQTSAVRRRRPREWQVTQRLRAWTWPWLAMPVIGLITACLALMIWRALPASHPVSTPESTVEVAPMAGTLEQSTEPATESAPKPAPTTARPQPQPVPAPTTTSTPAQGPTTASTATGPAAQTGPAEPVASPLNAAIAPLNTQVQKLAQLWQPGYRLARGEKACTSLHRDRLECLKGNGEWADLSAMNVPAVLTLNRNSGLHYVLLQSLDRDSATFAGANGPVTLPLAAIDPVWTGEYLALWRRETDETTIGPETRGEPVLWLRKRLQARLGHAVGDPADPLWDEQLRKAVAGVQANLGIKADGLASGRTLLALSSLPGPQLGGGKPAKTKGRHG
jgi:general secretion pathway protein A